MFCLKTSEPSFLYISSHSSKGIWKIPSMKAKMAPRGEQVWCVSEYAYIPVLGENLQTVMTTYPCWLHRCSRTTGGSVCRSGSAVYGESAGPAVPCNKRHKVYKSRLTIMQPYLIRYNKHREVVLHSWPAMIANFVFLCSVIYQWSQHCDFAIYRIYKQEIQRKHSFLPHKLLVLMHCL